MRWRASQWAGMAVPAAGLLALTVALYRETWLVVPLAFFALLTPLLTAIDLRWLIVPNRLVLPSVGAIFVFGAGSGILDGQPLRVLWMAAGSAALFAIYLVLALVAPGSMGMGDVKLAILVGAVLGAIAWPGWVLGMVAGFVVGAVVGLAGLALRSVTLRSQLPYAPSMLAGAWIGIVLVATLSQFATKA